MQNDKTMFVFPGQGTQTIGMGADLARDFLVAKAVFDEIDETLHQNLSKLMFSGDLDELTQTQNAQPAIMAVSMAVFEILKTEGASLPQAVAGHSLGEYSALCAAGVLTLSDTAKLLQARGNAMVKACLNADGGMLALLGATPEQVSDISKKSGCYIANDNCPGQIVLSGLIESIQKAQELAEHMQIKRAVRLPVMGAFHSPLMQTASDEISSLLESTTFMPPQIPVYFNVTADIDMEPTHYPNLLIKQITSPVRWRELIANSKAKNFIECGTGCVLSGLIRRILPDTTCTSIGTTQDIKTFLTAKS